MTTTRVLERVWEDEDGTERVIREGFDVLGRSVISALMDANIVTDYASEYGEPGYTADGPIMFGDWWCHKRGCPREDVHGVELHYPRLFRALESVGAVMEWYDEWVVVNDKAYRTSADSYSWTPTAVFDGEGDYLTPDDDISEWVEWAVNDSSRCLMPRQFSDAQLLELGFEERECGFENGWHPGQNDDPDAISRTLRERESVDVLFMLQGVGQFDCRFCVYVRAEDGEEGEDA